MKIPEETVAASPLLALGPGTLLAGRYLIAQVLGRGGEGTVHAAVDTRFGAPVAVKVAPHSDRESRARLRREARIGHVLGHAVEGVVRCLDWGELAQGSSGGPATALTFIVLDLVDGARALDVASGSVRARLDRFERALEIVAGVHARGVVHRDLKPGNFLVTAEGEVFLSDFGLAKELSAVESDEQPELTARGLAMGTPIYMPPEQFFDARGVDLRADVYALGAVLFRLLTGELPYPGRNALEVITQQHAARQGDAPAPRLRRRRPRISPALDELCARALDLDRERRPPDAGALLEGLRAVRAGRAKGRCAGAAPPPVTPSSERPTARVARPATPVAQGGPSSGHEAVRAASTPRRRPRASPPRKQPPRKQPPRKQPPRKQPPRKQPPPTPLSPTPLPPTPGRVDPRDAPTWAAPEPQVSPPSTPSPQTPSARAPTTPPARDEAASFVVLGEGLELEGVLRVPGRHGRTPAVLWRPTGGARQGSGSSVELEVLARVLAEVEHPGVVRQLARGPDGLCLEALAQLPSPAPRGFPLALALDLGLDLLAAVAHLHARGFAHARLDLDAVALRGCEPRGAPPLARLGALVRAGAARAVLQDLRSARSFSYLRALARGRQDPELGPPLPPDPAFAPAALGARGDLQAAGLVLHTWLTGSRPFAAALRRGAPLAALRRTGACPLEGSSLRELAPPALAVELRRLLADMVGAAPLTAAEALARLTRSTRARASSPGGPARQGVV